MKRLWIRFKQWFRDMRFRHKLMLTYVFIGIIPIIFLGVFCYIQTRNILIEREKTNLQEFLSQSVSNMDNQIEIYNNLSDYLSYNQTISQVVGYDYKSNYERYEQYTKVLNPMLYSLKYFHSDLSKITIYTSNTKVKHDTTLDSLDEIKKMSWYKKLHMNDTKSIYWFVDKKTSKAFSVRSMQCMQENDIEGVMYLETGSDKLFQTYTTLASSDYGLYVEDEEGRQIFAYSGVPKSKLTLTQCKAGDNDYAIVNKQTKAGWKVWLFKPNDAIYDSIWSIVFVLLVVISVCVVAALLASTTISKFMVSGILQLKRNMTAVESGKMDVFVTSDSKDEIGELIRGFGKMLNRINTLIEEVYKGELTQREYEMKALQAQINPHFLYNSLSLINWKALEAQQPDISRLTLLLSTFYRTALNKGNNLLSVRDEVSNMSSYLDIQLMMHDNNFDTDISIPREIQDYATLNLVLQPLIENAIDHGIDLKEDGRGWIHIYGYEENDDIYLVVEDNGVGMEQEKVDTILTQHSKGYGVRNVNERIELLFGKEYGLEVESQIGKGTKIIVHMPKKEL